MVKKVSASQAAIFKKLSKIAPSAHKTHSNTEAKISGGASLPAGIAGGVCCFKSWKLDTQKNGKNVGTPYVSITMTVQEPEEFRGMAASKTIFIRETRNKSVEDKVGDVYNQIKLLGGDVSDTENLQEAVMLLEDLIGTYSRFHTWVGKATKDYPNPQVQVEFDGKVDGYEGDAVEEEEDDSVPCEQNKEQAVEEEQEQEIDLNALGKSADDGDVEAEDKLIELATEHAVDHEEFDTWMEVVQAIQATQKGNGQDVEEEVEEEEEDSWIPEVGEVYTYKEEDCEVMTVNKRKKTVSIQLYDEDDTEVKDVNWEELAS